MGLSVLPDAAARVRDPLPHERLQREEAVNRLVRELMAVPPRPPLRPHVQPRRPGYDDPNEDWYADMHDLPYANERERQIADYWLNRDVRLGGKPRALAARRARFEALNAIFELGRYAPAPHPSEY